MVKSSFFIVSVSLTLAGCASPPKYDYVKQGASQYERTNALSECTYQIKLNKTAAQEQRDLLHLCMQGKGFRYVKVQ